jgi:hypothetical protein
MRQKKTLIVSSISLVLFCQVATVGLFSLMYQSAVLRISKEEAALGLSRPTSQPVEYIPSGRLSAPIVRHKKFDSFFLKIESGTGASNWGSGGGASGWREFISISTPFWSVFFITSVFPVVAFTLYLIRTRHHRRVGHCTMCGYDLTGNTTGKSPECGQVDPVPVERGGAGCVPGAHGTSDTG